MFVLFDAACSAYVAYVTGTLLDGAIGHWGAEKDAWRHVLDYGLNYWPAVAASTS